MAQPPKRRDPKQKPLPHAPATSEIHARRSPAPEPKATADESATKWLPCKRCMGFGGMGGGCPSCGGTGFR
jgi:hypothetical protein